MKRTWMIISLVAIVLTACSPTPTSEPSAYPMESPYTVPTTVDAYPGPSGTDVSEVLPGACDVGKPCEWPTSEVKTPDYSPLPADKNLTRADAHISDMDVVLSQTEPVQGILQISGELPNPCYSLRAEVSEPDADQVINVDIYTVVDPNAICAQVIKPYAKNIELGVLPAGKYSVKVNGTLVGEIMLP